MHDSPARVTFTGCAPRGFIKLMLSQWIDGGIIFAVVVLNALLGFMVFFLVVETEKFVIRSSDSLRRAVTVVEAGT